MIRTILCAVSHRLYVLSWCWKSDAFPRQATETDLSHIKLQWCGFVGRVLVFLFAVDCGSNVQCLWRE